MRHPFHHLKSQNGESWMGLIDGVYAIAMTLIAIELPQLFKNIITIPATKLGISDIIILAAHETVAYAATFLILYELWVMHKSILILGGLKRQIQSLLNGAILAFTCLGAGIIIFTLNEKTESAIHKIKDISSHFQPLSGWCDIHSTYTLSIFITIAIMFLLMAQMARSSIEHTNSVEMRMLARSAQYKGYFFTGCIILWAPLLFGKSLQIPPTLPVLVFFIASFGQEAIFHWLNKFRSNS